MTNEEMQERIHFIIEQQANFTTNINLLTTDINLLKEAQAQLTAKVDTLVEIQAGSEIRLSRVEDAFVLLVQMAKLTDGRLDSLDGRLNSLDERLGSLTDKMAVLTEAQVRTDRNIAELVEAQAHTDERLNTLINVVERYISKGNGDKP